MTIEFDRFDALFGPNSHDRPGLPGHLRQVVFARMKYALADQDRAALRKSRIYFMKTFHPDHAGGVFTRAERATLFLTIPHIFDGEPPP